MSDPHSQMSPQTFGIVITGVLGFFGVCLGAVLKWFGGRPSQAAALQTSLNDALRIFMAESQADHVRQAARISELEGDLAKTQHELELTQDKLGDALRDRQTLSGEVVNLQQSQQSLMRLLEKQGHSPIPQDSVLRREGDDG